MAQKDTLERLRQILATPTATERGAANTGVYECPECGTSKKPTRCRTKGCICCPNCGATR